MIINVFCPHWFHQRLCFSLCPLNIHSNSDLCVKLFLKTKHDFVKHIGSDDPETAVVFISTNRKFAVFSPLRRCDIESALLTVLLVHTIHWPHCPLTILCKPLCTSFWVCILLCARCSIVPYCVWLWPYGTNCLVPQPCFCMNDCRHLLPITILDSGCFM